jgi:Tic22-like family
MSAAAFVAAVPPAAGLTRPHYSLSPGHRHAFCAGAPPVFARRVVSAAAVAAGPPPPPPPRRLRIAPTAMADNKGGTSPLLRGVATLMVVALIATSVLPLSGGLKNAFTDTGGALVDQKLHRVPVFTVADGEGRPFLVEAEDHLSRRGFFFEDVSDAERYLTRVRSEGPADAKVLPVGMDEALKFATKRQSSNGKTVPEVFTLRASEHELAVAGEVTGGQFQATFGDDAVPVYYAEGLAFASPAAGGTSGVAEGGAGAVYPLFFQKSALDKTLDGLREKDPAAAEAIGDIQVLSLQQTVKVGGARAPGGHATFVSRLPPF